MTAAGFVDVQARSFHSRPVPRAALDRRRAPLSFGLWLFLTARRPLADT